MTDQQIEDFKAAARPIFGTISGSNAAGLRIAVRNITAYRQVAALVEQYGGTIAPTTRRYPELVKITFDAYDDSEDCNCGVPNPHPGMPFDCPMHGPRE
jgi:hypothetical protein